MEDQYRRGMYTFRKRASPYPSFRKLDASRREVCLVDRSTTNTPVQALTTLNDPVYLEAAVHLAKRMEDIGKNNIHQAIAAGYRFTMQRPPTTDKLAALEKLFQEAHQHYTQQPAEAAKLIGATSDAAESSVLTAAYTMVANALLNLDEFLTKS